MLDRATHHDPQDDDLLTSADAARELGVVPDTVRLAVRRGALVPSRVTLGGIRLFTRSEINRYRQARERRS